MHDNKGVKRVIYKYKKCDVGLHVDCFAGYHQEEIVCNSSVIHLKLILLSAIYFMDTALHLFYNI